ncbi:MAG: CBS domain-containing protein [Thermodesulfobacteriota bacterium]
MDLITTHTNADFDTLSSMVAAKMLYPDAVLSFPGSLEKELKSALEGMNLGFSFVPAEDIDIDSIKRLILVDIKSPSRIGRFSLAAKKKGVEVHVYDHHPITEGDIRGEVEVIKPYGSTTTIMTLILKEKGIRPSPSEATVILAGIYEDTGNLTFMSTVPEDFEAAGFLRSCDADLKTIKRLLTRELSPEEVSALDELIKSQASYTINGSEVIIAAISLEQGIGDVSALAHRLVDIEKMNCLVLLAETENRVHVVIRSGNPRIHAGEVAFELGGGGHPQAASATMKNVTLIEAKEAAIRALRKKTVPQKTAFDIMSAPAIIISPGKTLVEAAETMRRYNVNALPVVIKKTPEGIITRQVVDKAVFHGLGAERVESYMTIDIESVETGTSVDEVRDKVLLRGQRLLPVVKDGEITGVVTRTDLLKLLHEELSKTPSTKMHKRVLTSLMKEKLPTWAFTFLKESGETAEKLGFRAYAVGGFVRDLLLRRNNLDMDIVVEGDGLKFAARLAKIKGLKISPHERFRTAVLSFPDGRKVDVATARIEYYERPGALPTVEESSLKLDLYRRDFTINTLAVALNPGRFGELIDFFGAERDIKEKTVRVLHNMSFVEDPTRLIRAVRFAERFDFKISKHTLHLVKNSVKLGILKQTSMARVMDEIKNTLEEERAISTLKRLFELGILPLIHKKLKWNGAEETLFERAKEAIAWFDLLYTQEKIEGWMTLYLALTDNLSNEELLNLTRSLSLPGRKRLLVVQERARGLKALNLISAGKVKSNSGLFELLNPLPLELLLYLVAKASKEDARKAVTLHITKLRNVKNILTGNDLKKLGVKQGPSMGRILNMLHKRKLDGKINSREDEEAFVKWTIKKK